jgi:hypothetical protein
MRVIDLKTDRVRCSLGSLEEKDSPHVCISLHETEERFAVARENGDVQLWRIPTHMKEAEWSLCTVVKTSARLALEHEFETSVVAAELALSEFDIARALSAVRKARGVSGFENHPRCMRLLYEASKFCRIKGLKNCWKEKALEGVTIALCAFAPSARTTALPYLPAGKARTGSFYYGTPQQANGFGRSTIRSAALRPISVPTANPSWHSRKKR